MFIVGCPVCPNNCRGIEVPPIIYVLVTLPPCMVAKGFELSKGFQLQGLLKGTEVAPLLGAGIEGHSIVTIGVGPKGFRDPPAIVVTAVLGPSIGWLLGLPIIGVEQTTDREYGGEPRLVSIGIDLMGAGCETDVGAAEDISWLGVI